MEHQLNNPLRPASKLLQQEAPMTDGASANLPKKTEQIPDRTQPPLKKSNINPSESAVQKSTGSGSDLCSLDPDVRRALDQINAPEELRNLMIQLSKTGIEFSGPKKIFVKHSYEIEQDLHRKFHEMYPVLGYKKVKDAINDAISSWCESHESEFQRRSGKAK